MTDHTYDGRTLAEIKEAAEKATPGPWHDGLVSDHVTTPITDGSFAVVAQVLHRSDDGKFIATANPATVLAMAARIEELEMDIAEHQAFANEIRQIVGDDWKATPHGLADKVRNRIDDLVSDHAAALHLVAEVRHACGDDGKRMSPELVQYLGELVKDAARYAHIKTMEPRQFQRLWSIHQFAGEPFDPLVDKSISTAKAMATLSCGAAPNSAEQWPHPDGFAGGLTERGE